MEIKVKLQFLFQLALLFVLPLLACNGEHKHVGDPSIVATPEEINDHAGEIIRQSLRDVLSDRHFADSLKLKNSTLLNSLYDENGFELLWSSEGSFTPSADSLFSFIRQSRLYGLFPSDYYEEDIERLREQLRGDSAQQVRLDASRWALGDLLLTSAFVQIVKDLKKGRLLPDSVMQKDSLLSPQFFRRQLDQYRDSSTRAFAALEPAHSGYHQLKASIQSFLDSSDLKKYTYVQAWDSAKLKQLVYKRIGEEDSVQMVSGVPDSSILADAIKTYQKRKGLKADGKISQALISRLNDTGRERFIRIAITLDRYKMMERLPEQYIWVNIPTYRLQLKEADTVVMVSKVAVGKTNTPTPEITSAISDMITYPQWTIPASIIQKEILPGLQRDPGYTNRKGYSILDSEGNVVDPYFVDWSKYKKGIPYKVIQGSGDANALGVIKFNFPNKHSVYLHDTNQRYLFSRKNRALSHGCVRVESWRQLAHFILRNDSLHSANATPVDSLQGWLAQKERHVIPVRKRIPLYIRYFTCEGEEGRVVFHEDIYGQDRRLRDKYFAHK
jgi:murein L,D-transpeptidase YcbB/YkuD